MLWWLLVIGILTLVYYYFNRKYQYWKDRNVPHVKPVFFFGNIFPFLFRQVSQTDWFDNLYNSYSTRYIGLYRFTQPSLMIKDLDIIKQICVKEFDNFMNHRGIVSEDVDPIFGKNLFSLKGQPWREMRANLSPAFTGSKMRTMFQLIAECADQFTKYFERKFEIGKSYPMEMKEILSRFANDVIASAAFGIKCDSLEEPENDFYISAKKVTNFEGAIKSLKLLLFVLSPKLSKLLRIKLFGQEESDFFNDLIIGAINHREKEGTYRPDMIQLLIEAKKGKLRFDDGNNVTSTGFATVEESQIGKDAQLRKQVWSDIDLTAQGTIFLFAGFDTVSTILCFMAYEMALNMDIQRKLQDEIDEIYEETDGKITYEAIIKMKYMDQVISEVLRKWTPLAAVDRECNKTYTIPATEPGESPVTLNKGDLVWLPIYSIHRDPKYYSDPDRFDPERFNEENKKNIIPYSYFPFGIGPRSCIGSRFALLEIKLLTYYLLLRFDILTNERTQIPFKFSLKNIALVPMNGHWVNLKRRERTY